LNQRVAVATSLLLIVVATIVAVIYLLGRPPSESNLVIIGGLAGGSAATLALIVQSRGWSVLTGGIARYGLIAAFSSVVAGFLAGAFSVLAAIALIGTSTTKNDMSGAAILGGIYGLLLGAYWSQIVLATEDKETLLGTAISEISGRVGPSVVNYRGKVCATLTPATNEQLVRGRLEVWFSTKSEPTQPAPHAKASDAKASGAQVASAPIIIEGGSRKARAEFAVTVLGTSTTTAFPRRQLAVAPTDGESEKYEFTLVQEGPGDAGDASRLPPLGPMLIDVSQSGRTIMVLEVSSSASEAATI
jgi:hypothetical protein